jgi:16S rRNA (cytidine1402-2'-O)-methyltransferase
MMEPDAANLFAAQFELPPGGGLFVVALPIGNPRDITLRALDTLRAVDVIASEDTRDFQRLARLYGLATPLLSYHDFNEQARAGQLLARMQAGQRVALVSDAGTPLVSDPGYRVVAAAVAAGLPVTSLPGPCAFVTALAACGLPVNQFSFLGFPPRAAAARRAFFARVAHEPATLVLYEAPHRLLATLTDASAVLGERAACLARNLTKRHETYQRGVLAELLALLAAEDEVRGEATVIISGAGTDSGRPERVESAADDVRRLLADGLDSKAVLERVMQTHGLGRRDVYALILAAKRSGDAPSM